MLHAGKTLQIEQQSGVWQLVPCSQRADEDTRLSKRTAQILRREQDLSRGRRCVSLGKRQDPHHHRNAKGGGRLSLQLVVENDEIHGQRKIRDMLGPPHRWRKSMLHSEHHFRKQHVGWHYRAKIQPTFFSHKSIEKGDAKELNHIGLAKFETAIKPGSLLPGGVEKRTTCSLLDACQRHGQEPGNRPKVCTHLRCRREAQDEDLKFYQTLNGCVISFNTIPEEHIKRSSTWRQGTDIRQDSWLGCTSTVKFIINVGTAEKTQSTSIVKVIGTDTPLEKTLCVIQKQIALTNWQLTPNQALPGPPEQRKLGGGGTDLQEDSLANQAQFLRLW